MNQDLRKEMQIFDDFFSFWSGICPCLIGCFMENMRGVENARKTCRCIREGLFGNNYIIFRLVGLSTEPLV